MIQEIFNLQNPWRSGIDCSFDLKGREILDIIFHNLENKKMLGLIGSRQVGKSSIIYLIVQHLIKNRIDKNNIFYFNLDDLKLHELFTSIPDFIHFLGENREKRYVLIDEVQRLENPGLFLKEVYDLNLNIKIIYSGSSQLEVKSKLKEHLVGRTRQFEIHRLAFKEYLHFSHPITRKQALEHILVYGSYPAVAMETNKTEKKLSIKDIYQSYVEKDLVDFLRVDNVNAFNNLIILLANQMGNLLSIDGLSKSLRISRNHTERYINILENTFIIKRIYPFHRNYKKEITKTPKIYFVDLGLRNFVLNNFNPLALRNDVGNLFENFFLLELLKDDHYSLNKIKFWRTTNQTGIDFIISGEGQTEAIEVKWEKESIPKSFETLKKYYPEIQTRVVTKNQFLA